jgi:hypothetical protein
MRFCAFFAKFSRNDAMQQVFLRPASPCAGLTMRQRAGAFCTDPERDAPLSSPSSSFQNHSLDCLAAVRVR